MQFPDLDVAMWAYDHTDLRRISFGMVVTPDFLMIWNFVFIFRLKKEREHPLSGPVAFKGPNYLEQACTTCSP